MALPTISSISPSTLWTAGQLITINGTNFKTWTVPSTSTGPLPDPTPTVQVTVGGIACTKVSVKSATLLTCFAPAHDVGAGAVIVTNLDSSAVAIPGESSTAGSVTYKRPDLTQATDLERTHNQVIATLRQQIIDNVVQFVSEDYAETPFEFTMVGKLPALLLLGPSLVESERSYRQNADTEVGTFDGYEAPDVVDLEYELTVVTANTRQLVTLEAVVKRFFKKTQGVTVARDTSDLSKGYITYVMEKRLGDRMRVTTTANKQNVNSFDVSFRVLGVLSEGLTEFPGENLTQKGGVANDITVTISGTVEVVE